MSEEKEKIDPFDTPVVRRMMNAFPDDFIVIRKNPHQERAEKKAETEFQEYVQSPDMSDSEMIEVIKDYIALGWSAAEYSWKDGIKTWIFQKG